MTTGLFVAIITMRIKSCYLTTFELMLSSTKEDYLSTIYKLEEMSAQRLISTSALAEAMGLTHGTVTVMVKKLAEEKLLVYEAYNGCALTTLGLNEAVKIVRRHRLIETFLVQVIGLDWSEVHDEAERMEHVISDRVLEGIDKLLGYPEADPHGDPIPREEENLKASPFIRLSECCTGNRYLIDRIMDENKDFLLFVGSKGLIPGAGIVIEQFQPEAGVIQVRIEDGDLVPLGFDTAAKLLVSNVTC
ncbi:MAG: hypothetical protein CSB34_05820 [Desulfobulbus propionicus]|nr:MAG: hypothetical protein CSB34_05820 [Desulfobulbus propionicus]